MSLLTPDRTRYDLNFRLNDIPVRVHPGFWIVHGVIGATTATGIGAWAFFLWIACAFVSIVIHELGHVLAGRQFGARGEIVLTVFGGHAGASADLGERSHRIIVYLSGPAAQLLLAGTLALVCSTFRLGPWAALPPPPQYPVMPQPSAEAGNPADAAKAREFQEEYVRASQEYMQTLMAHFFSPAVLAVVMLVGINIGWGLFNLIPIPPLDGGRVLMELIGRHPDGDHKPWELDPDWWKR